MVKYMKCRACDNENIFLAIELGNIPIAGDFEEFDNPNPYLVETNMVVCRQCGLGQTSIDLDPKQLFNYYMFKTSVSKSFLEHSRKYAEKVIEDFNITKDDWVLELASNDGYMLKIFKEKGIDVLGVDPAKNIAMEATMDGIPTLSKFFGSKLAKQILSKRKPPKLIIANNVLAHVPNIQDFMNGISMLCSEETIVSIENPSIINILEKDHFDTIFHEHYSYLSCYSVSKLANKFGLELFDVEKISTHGGSNRYWLSKSKERKQVVNEIIDEELNIGLLNSEKWQNTFNRIKNNVDKFNKKVLDINNAGGIICGYTASSKSTVLLNFAGIKRGAIKAIADDVFEKQNHFVPGPAIPITNMEDMLKHNPTDIIVFSWNIIDDIKKKISDAGHPNINVWAWNE